ncbi:hypothetical protein [Streptomyces sp. NPDC020983]|uniref:hypothetical protein n=1 Tax=Streptomyces sp. NPDC020983 TaxID=3365106 RepID=UPI0037992CED
MNDFAGVEPHRVRQLADRLQDLATALAGNGPVIRNNFGTWGPALIDLGPLAAQAAQVAHDGAKEYLDQCAELRGEVSSAGKHIKLSDAEMIDAAHKNEVLWLNAVGGFLASVPTTTVPADFVKAAIWGALPTGSNTFSTGDAATVESASKAQFFDDSTTMRIALVQGLATSGKIDPPPPANHPEWASGRITLSDTDDKTDFDRWWLKVAAENGNELDHVDSAMRRAFNNGATQ